MTMLSEEERKVIVRAIRIEAVIEVSQKTEEGIRNITESDILFRDLIMQIWENAQRRLRSQNNAHLLERSKLADYDYYHRTRTLLGSMKDQYDLLKESVPPSANLHKLHYWDKQWEEQKGKSKRADQLDRKSLPKRLRITQDAAAESSRAVDVSGTGAIMRTVYNAQCTHLIGIPHEAVVEGRTIGSGAFGEVKEYKIRGVSFLPEHITYCGKLYKGDASKKFDSFQTEQGMQVLHPSIVRCIAFTKESPWITIFPFFNGGSLGDMLLKVPMRYSEFTKAMYRLDQGWKKPPPSDTRLSQVQLARIKAMAMNMPHIMHALVDGMAAAHMAGIVHSDLHPFNVVLDFTKDVKASVGIIDWGLMLRAPNKHPAIKCSMQTKTQPRLQRHKPMQTGSYISDHGWLQSYIILFWQMHILKRVTSMRLDICFKPFLTFGRKPRSYGWVVSPTIEQLWSKSLVK